MFGRVWDFVKRHKRKFIFAGVVIGGGYALKNYAVTKIKEWEEKQMSECLERLRKQQHFESTQNTCTSTVLSFVRNIQDEINKQLETDQIIAALRNKPENRARIFEDLKILAFSRTIAAVYSCSLLALQLHVKLSILGGYMFIDTKRKVNGENLGENGLIHPTVPIEMQQMYLGNVQHLIGPGLEVMIKKIMKAVHAVLGEVSIKDSCSIANLEMYFKQIRFNIEHEENGINIFEDLDELLLPKEKDFEVAGPSSSLNCTTYQGLMDETRDILESSDCRAVLSDLLNQGFSRVLDYFTEFFSNEQGQGDGDSFANINEMRVALAKLVPVANGLLFTLCNSEQSDFLIHMLGNEKLKSLSANIYEAFLSESSC